MFFSYYRSQHIISVLHILHHAASAAVFEAVSTGYRPPLSGMSMLMRTARGSGVRLRVRRNCGEVAPSVGYLMPRLDSASNGQAAGSFDKLYVQRINCRISYREPGLSNLHVMSIKNVIRENKKKKLDYEKRGRLRDALRCIRQLS